MQISYIIGFILLLYYKYLMYFWLLLHKIYFIINFGVIYDSVTNKFKFSILI